MRKIDLVNKIAEKTGVPKVDILMVVEAFFKETIGSLKEGEPVFIRGFGTFNIKTRKARTARNVKKNIAIHVPEHKIPSFKPAKEFVETIKQSHKG